VNIQSNAVEFCAKIDTDFADVGGDFWEYNAPRRARGMYIAVTDYTGTWTVVLEGDGCASVSVTVDTDVDDRYLVTAYSYAEVNGVTLKSWYDNGTSEANVSFPQMFVYSDDFPLMTIPDYTIHTAVWQNLAVGMWAFYRNDMNLGDFGNTTGCGGETGCCGTSTTPCCFHEPYQNLPTATEVHFVAKEDSNYGSLWDSDTYGEIPAVRTKYASGRHKYFIAHELGHVIVMLRMGGRTETDYNAKLNACMGSYKQDGTPEDVGGSSEKSLLTREFSAAAAREGWAHFYASWLWNRRTENDCYFKSFTVQDFDLDGDIDNDYTDPDQIGSFSCDSVLSSWGEPDPTDPLESYVSDYDWLEDMYAYSPSCPSVSSSTDGHSTQFDWMRYFWDMTSTEEVAPSVLSDIYVDMCPLDWVESPSGTSNDNWPHERLERSAIFHGQEDEHNAQKVNGVDH